MIGIESKRYKVSKKHIKTSCVQQKSKVGIILVVKGNWNFNNNELFCRPPKVEGYLGSYCDSTNTSFLITSKGRMCTLQNDRGKYSFRIIDS